MKNFVKWFGIIALVVVVGFSMTACPAEDNDGGGNAGIGTKLELSGQVYTRTFNPINFTVTFSKYEGNLMISDNNGGNATITNGELSYTIETPNDLYLDTWNNLQDSFFYGYDNVTASDSSAKGFVLQFYNHDDTYYSLSKENTDTKIGNTSGSQTSESVSYVYVDKDVTITGKGKSQTGSMDEDNPNSGTYTSKTNNFSLALKKGWNAVYTKSAVSFSYPPGNPSALTSATSTSTISLNNPALKWVLETDD